MHDNVRVEYDLPTLRRSRWKSVHNFWHKFVIVNSAVIQITFRTLDASIVMSRHELTMMNGKNTAEFSLNITAAGNEMSWEI